MPRESKRMPEVSEQNPVTGSDCELGERTPSRPVSVNWHLWPWCNYGCTFCYATFPGIRSILPKEEALKVLRLLKEAGCEKVTFAGGEPTLCTYLPDLLRAAKECGLVTMIVTNGTRITEEYLRRIAPWTDWIAISVDSAREDVEAALGRGVGDHVRVVREAARLVRAFGVRLKVNTVVTALTWEEDMHPLIRELGPERWKVFQALPIRGENDAFDGWVTDAQFRAFMGRHADLDPIGEDNDAMTDSYVMLDPLGRFYQNAEGLYTHSEPVLEVGVLTALGQVGWNRGKMDRRGGLWDWAGFPRGHGSRTAPSPSGREGST